MARRTTIINTRLEILQEATRLFLTEGYSNATVSNIANRVGISLGNLTFHFPTKESLLEELIKHLCAYHMLVMEQEIDDGKTSLLAYLMELASMMAICDEDAIARDLYISAYTHSLPLRLIRQSDTEKAKLVFSEFCPEWTDEDFAAAENIVSGIEYASLRKENAEDVSLDKRITSSLRAVMRLYNVPEELRNIKIDKIHAMDYRRIGSRLINGFTKYVEDVNRKALEEVLEQEKLRGGDDNDS